MMNIYYLIFFKIMLVNKIGLWCIEIEVVIEMLCMYEFVICYNNFFSLCM